MINMVQQFTLFLCALTFNSLIAIGQKRHTIGGVGTLDIPFEMELQSGRYKQFNDSQKSRLNIRHENTVIFQQKGLNDGLSGGLETYARIIIETINGGDQPSVQLESGVSNAELREVNNLIRNSVESGFQGSNLKLIAWLGTQIVKLNGRNVIRYHYIRQLDNHPEVDVKVYYIPNYDRVHLLTMSYWIIDQKKWKPLFQSIINSFIIYWVK